MRPIWEEGFWPEEVWITLGNLAPFAAFVAFLGAVYWLWQRGPGLLVKYGPEWMTKLGNRWAARREQ